ncbi:MULTISPECIES: HalOD1 output domain-containing protein [Haloarcula]|uniref:HalOD1 output domain-containing protein n=1 Tax=Haloarcula TaxID=2237 RepID=UPI0023E87EA0|nr:HalOD1 output domain-containing protein [Halomicroarcula sp. SHR3]
MVVTLAGVKLEPLESQTGPDCHRFEYEQDTTPASMAVVAALSEVNETDPMELQPLQQTIDADALDALVAGGEADSDAVAVTLDVAAYTVTVSGDGVVAVSPSATQRPEAPTGTGCQL